MATLILGINHPVATGYWDWVGLISGVDATRRRRAFALVCHNLRSNTVVFVPS